MRGFFMCAFFFIKPILTKEKEYLYIGGCDILELA